MIKKGEPVIVVITCIFSGLVWGIIYLTLETLHDMAVMFNKRFIFLIANIFDVNVTTVFKGFIYSFLDGLLIGVIAIIILLKLKRKFIDKSKF